MTRSIVIWMLLLAGALAPASAQQAEPEGMDSEVTAMNQRRLREDFEQLVGQMIDVAELLEPTKPDVAATIRQAVRMAQEAFIAQDMNRVIEQIERGLLASADDTQGQVLTELREMLEVIRRGTIEPDERWELIEQWREQLEQLERLIEREQQLERQSRLDSRGEQMSERLAALAQQLRELVEQEQQIRDESSELGAPASAVEQLAGLRGRLDALRNRQQELTEATENMTIAQLPAGRELQQQINQQLGQIEAELAEMTGQDGIAAEAIEQAGQGAAVERATESLSLASQEMSGAAEALGASNKTAAGDRQDQAGHDLSDAIEALDEAIAGISADTEAGALVGRQEEIRRQTDALDEQVRQAVSEAEDMLGDQGGQPGQEGQQGQSGQAGQEGPQGQSGQGGQEGQQGQQGQSGQQGQQGQSNLQRASQAMGEASQRLQQQNRDQALAAEDEALSELQEQLEQVEELGRQIDEQTARSDQADQQNRQEDLAGQTGQLGEQMSQPNSQGSSTPGSQSVGQASESMGEAAESLGQQDSEQANEQQNQALEELQVAREQLERAIAEQERLAQADALARVEALLREVLRSQEEVNDATGEVYTQRVGDRYNRPEQLRLVELANRQGRNADEIDRVVGMIREEGTTAVFPTILERVGQDMRNVQQLLSEQQAGAVTQGAQEQIVQMLRELIDALQQERNRRQQQQQSGGGGGGGGGGGPLVPFTAELKMLRVLQQQVYDRTRQLDMESDDPQADREQLRRQHELLSDRQEYIEGLTRQLDQLLQQMQGGGR